MKAPSIKTLTAAFRDLTREDAKTIRKLIHACASRDEIESLITDPASRFPVTRKWANSCYSSPFTSQGWRETMLMSALSEIVSGFGEESAYGKGQDRESFGTWPRYRYVNTGDTYSTTLILNHDTREVRVGCYGDLPLGE